MDPRTLVVWPGSDEPLPLTRRDVQEAALLACQAWGVAPGRAAVIAADAGTAAAGWFLEQGEREESPAPPVDAIPESFREGALASLAGTLRRRGLVAEEILPTLLAVNARRCDPPLPVLRVERIARKVAKLPAERPMFAVRHESVA